MTVTNLWNTCGNWTSSTKVHICVVGFGFESDYIHHEEVLKHWANREVISFRYYSYINTMHIDIA